MTIWDLVTTSIAVISLALIALLLYELVQVLREGLATITAMQGLKFIIKEKNNKSLEKEEKNDE